MTEETPDTAPSTAHDDFVRMQRQAAQLDVGQEPQGRHRARRRRVRWTLTLLILAAAVTAGMFVLQSM